jgi:hypothetical protein
LNACTLEEAKRGRAAALKVAELERKIGGNVLH